MAIDLSRFIATFFDETQEHLESIEERAMTLGRGDPDPETLNAIFRAAHSIKGGSGTFGFTQPSANPRSMIAFSMFLIVTAGSVMPSTHAPSQGAGHVRPVNSGKLLVLCSRSSASRHRP